MSNNIKNPDVALKKESQKSSQQVTPWEGSRPTMPLNKLDNNVYDNFTSQESPPGLANLTPGATINNTTKLDVDQE